jgi:2-polyprenyl-3-methyl-5-hydroxy-6-metoxy-1,4-benzoquinol methylase
MNDPYRDYRIERRVAGYHDIRLDGMTDLVVRARGASVFDVGCNRGLVGFEMANNGAKIVHGCDNYELGIMTAKELFSDLRAVQIQFEVVDLSKGAAALAPFGDRRYDIVLMLATYHKIKRVMSAELLSELMRDLGRRTVKYFGWRATSTQHDENRREMKALDDIFRDVDLDRIHTSSISTELGLCAIWGRT